MPGTVKAFATDEPDNEFTNPKNQYRIHDFSFNNSYKDSDSNKDPNYIDKNINDDKSTFHHAFNTGA
jgi:hypothetical protein